MSDVRGIIIEFLAANGYDGLAGEECGCSAEDLAPCGDIPRGCEPAWRWRCAAGCHRLTDVGEGCMFEGEGCWRPERQGGDQ